MEKTDHDLLIEIHTVLKRAVQDIKDLKDNTAGRIENLEKKMEILERKVYADATFKKIVVWIGAAILALVIFQLTGYRINI